MNKTMLVFACAVMLAASGCATKKYVQQESQAVHTRIDDVEQQVESNQTAIDATNERVGKTEERVEMAEGKIQDVSKTAQEALDRAQEAGKLAEGKLLYETVLTEDKVKFASDKAKLDDGAKAAIDQFANQVKQENADIYIEIQGHTDATGGETHNEELGLERAESVRNYLSRAHKIPLHRMAVISYGENEPLGDNKTRDGRAQNRRVVLVVLR